MTKTSMQSILAESRGTDLHPWEIANTMSIVGNPSGYLKPTEGLTQYIICPVQVRSLIIPAKKQTLKSYGCPGLHSRINIGHWSAASRRAIVSDHLVRTLGITTKLSTIMSIKMHALTYSFSTQIQLWWLATGKMSALILNIALLCNEIWGGCAGNVVI